MIVFGALFLLLLALACALFLLPALRHGSLSTAITRDVLNTEFYHRRLAELAHDEDEGVVDERPAHIEELQQNLLADIPARPGAAGRPLSGWVLAPGVVALLAVTLGLYAWTGGARQLWHWRQTVDEMPALRARIMDPHAQQLKPEELERFAVGLRESLRRQPGNLQDWLILGRIGVVLNNVDMATHSFERAWRLKPEDDTIGLDYAEVLTRSADPGDNQEGGRLLQSLLKRQPDNVQALNLLAINQFEQNDFDQAIALWQHLLTLLPPGDSHIDTIRQSIAQAREQTGHESAKLDVTISLLPAVTALLPRQGTLFISVTDGVSPVPVAVKTLPLSRFPLSLSLDDANAMMPERLLSTQYRVKVKARISRSGSAEAESGDWFGESALQDFNGTGRIAVQIDKQMP